MENKQCLYCGRKRTIVPRSTENGDTLFCRACRSEWFDIDYDTNKRTGGHRNN